MKNNLKFLVIMVFAFGVVLQVLSQGYIVPNGVTYSGYTPGIGSIIQVIQNPNNGDITEFFLNPQGPQGAAAFQFASALDEGVRVFWVDPNDPISLQPIVAQNYTELLYPGAYVFDNAVPFYVGLYTGYNPWDSHGNYTGIYTDPVFGWARLVNNNGVIELLDSALEYGGGGIIAGTQTIIPIPEPGTIGLLALGGLLLGGRLRHKWRFR